MKTKRGILSVITTALTIPTVVIIFLIDKPDYKIFNFIYKNTIPVTEFIGRGVTYPFRIIGRTTENIKKNREKIKRADLLFTQVQELEKVKAENIILEKENQNLRMKLGFVSEIKYPTIVANIIHDDSFAGNQQFFAKNSYGNISVGNIALANNGFLLGIINEKAGSFVKIQSIRDVNSNISVKIAGTDVFGFLQGKGKSDPELKFLSNSDFDLEPGMFLITSGVNGNIPNNIPVGKIKTTDKNGTKIQIGTELDKQESVIILLFNKKEKYE